MDNVNKNTMEKLKRLAEKTGFFIGYGIAIAVSGIVLFWAFRFLIVAFKAVVDILSK